MVARVVVSNASYTYDKVYSYAVGPHLSAVVKPGLRVAVPFGAGNKKREALVVSLEDIPTEGLKEIDEVLEEQPSLDHSLLQVGAFLRRRYFCSYYEAFKALMPPGSSIKFKEYIALHPQQDAAMLNERYAASPVKLSLIKQLEAAGGVLEYAALLKKTGRSSLRKEIIALEEDGVLFLSYSDDLRVHSKTIRAVRLSIPTKEAVVLAESLQTKAPVQARMIDVLCQNELVALRDLLLFTQGSYSAVRALCNKGILTYEDLVVERGNPAPAPVRTEKFNPTAEQSCVIEAVNRKLSGGVFFTYLLRGVTGSGKTEVYLQLIEEVIRQGKQAIVLVPEISLTPQVVRLFQQRFGQQVAVFHSGLSLGERYDQWRRAKEGRVRVAIGARSCVFAPFSNLGIIIVDEEHSAAYQSELSPRYDAREVAAFRAKQAGAVLLLASATPSVESRYRCDTGEYHLLTMDTRYNDQEMPSILISDMRKELANGNPSVLGSRLREEIGKNIARGEQTILFLNRRGFSTFVSCRSCGYVVTCPNCSVSMTYHKKTNSLHCHYCGYRANMMHTCPECGSKHIRYFGVGTQRVEEEVHALFPQASTLRMDFDTTTSKFSHQRILKRFVEEKIDLLIGTQMVAKGLDLHNVTLVGVVAADLSLHADDFRCYERTFSQIVQVSGRAGRGDTPGRAVVQTYSPDSYAIQLARRHDYEAFYKSEIKFRKSLNYPPFCDIIILLFTGEQEEETRRAAHSFYTTLLKTTEASKEHFSILQPQPSGILKVGGKYRYQVQLKSPPGADLPRLIRPSLDYHYKKRRFPGVHVSVCINPENLY